MAYPTFEDALEAVGDGGVYQLCIVILLSMVVMLDATNITANFIGYVPQHWCSVPELLDLPHHIQRNIAAATEDIKDNGQIVYDSCHMFDLNYSSYSQDELLNWNRSVMVDNTTAVIGCQAWVYDQSVMVDNLVMKEGLVCGESWKIDLISSLTLVGFLFGSILCGYISDYFGRWPSLSIMLIVKTAGLFVSTFYQTYWMICVGRFVAGIGVIGYYISLNVLVFEIVGVGYRTLAGTSITVFSAIGVSLVPLYAYSIRGEEKLQLSTTLISAACLIVMWIVPESPRWILIKGKPKKAESILRHIAQVNRRIPPDELDIQVEKDEEINKGQVLQLFRSKNLRRYSFILYCIWLTTVLIYFALSVNIRSLAGDVFLNTFISGLLAIPANLISLYTMGVPGIGRRWSNAGALLIAGVASLIAVPLLLTSGEQSMVTTVMAMIGRAGSEASYNVMYVLTAEIYPTEVRNIGMGSCSMISRVGGIIAPYIGGSMTNIWMPLPSLIFGVTGCVSGILVLLLPETLGRKLPETIAEAENVVNSHKIHPSENENMKSDDNLEMARINKDKV